MHEHCPHLSVGESRLTEVRFAPRIYEKYGLAMKKRIILSAGGTGGHLFPAQSLAETLATAEILFVAGGLSQSHYFDRTQFAFEEIACATFSFSKPLQLLKGSTKIYKGLRQSQKIIRQFKPDLIVGFGSFFTLPILLGAILEKIPFVLHEQNAIPGRVNRFFAPYAKETTISFPITRSLLKGRGEEVLFPLRKRAEATKEECLHYFGLEPDKTTLLVFGGSSGAVRLNALFLDAVSKLDAIQVIHLAGNEERAENARKTYYELQIKACVKSFEPRMDLAMQLADLAITRAGASTVNELIEYELPALLIPYPFATDNHQEENGAHFVSQVKGGKMYKEKELTGEILFRHIQEMLTNCPFFKQNIRDFKQGRKTKTLASLIQDIIHD